MSSTLLPARPLRVVITGAGAQVFAFHRRALGAIGAEVVAVQDVNPDRLRPVAEEFGARAYGTVEELVSEPAELCVVLAPHPFHAEHTITALRAGKHVLVEKPMAVEIAEADRMNEEAERNGKVLAVVYQHRTRTEVREAYRLLSEGFLGRLQRADLLAAWPRRRTYFEMAPWRGTWRGEGGGVLINQGQHDLDLLCRLAGGLPSLVIARTKTQVHRIEAEDTVQALLEWPAGTTGSVHISTAEADQPQRLELTGTRGRMVLVPGRLELVSNTVDFNDFAESPGDPFGKPEVGKQQVIQGGSGGDHVDLYRDLAEALEQGRPPIAPGRDAAVTLELTNSITYSSKTGEEVRTPLDRAAYSALLESLRSTAGTRK